MISKWKHPIRYLRLVTTPACDKCRNYLDRGIFSDGECMCERYLEHINRVNGKRYKRADIDLVRGTRWCDFEPIEDEEDADD